MKKRSAIRLLALLLLLGGTIYGVTSIATRHADKTGGTLVVYGNVDIRQVQLAFNSMGRISKLYVQEGDPVTANQLVAELDKTRYEAAFDRASAQVAMQEQVVKRLTAGSRPEEIAAAKAQVRAAEATLAQAVRKREQAQALGKDDYVSRQQVDDSATAVELARANVDAAKQTEALAVRGPREEEIATAQAHLRAQQAARRLAQEELRDASLYAPTNGIIQNRILEPGDMASPRTPVLTLSLTDPLWVRAYVPEPELGRLSPGMRAEVTTDSFPDTIYDGWVGYISPTAEFTPKQVETTDLRTRLVYQIRVLVKNTRGQLRLGMPVTVRLPHATRQSQESADAVRKR